MNTSTLLINVLPFLLFLTACGNGNSGTGFEIEDGQASQEKKIPIVEGGNDLTGYLDNCSLFNDELINSFTNEKCFGIVNSHFAMDIDRGQEYHLYVDDLQSDLDLVIEYSDRGIVPTKGEPLLELTGGFKAKSLLERCRYIRHNYSGLQLKVYSNSSGKRYYKLKSCYSDYGHQIQVDVDEDNEFDDLTIYLRSTDSDWEINHPSSYPPN